MKKLKLDGKEMLSKQQMSKIIGGDYSGQCIFYDASGHVITWLSVNCSDNTGGHTCQCAADAVCCASNWCSNVNCVDSAAGCACK